MDLTDRLSFLEPVSDLAPDHQPDGGIDRITLVDPARAQRDARRSDRLSIHGGERTVCSGLDREDDRRPRQHAFGIVDDARVAPLGRNHRAEPLQRLSPIERLLGPRHRLVVRDVLRRLERPRREDHRQVPQPTPERSPEQLHRLHDVERVPDGVAERLRHVRHGDVGGTTPSSRQRQARPSEHLGILGRLHERARPGLHVEEDQVGLHRELLRHDARRDQRHRRHGRGGVPQGVELAVRRHEVRGLGGDRAPDVRHLSGDLLGRQVRPQARDRFELVERPSGVAEAAARQLGHGQTERGRHGCERERHAVGDTARRVFVDRRPAEIAERHDVARVDHRPGQGERLLVVEPAEQARHEERGGERVGDLSGGVSLDERLDVSGS